MKRPSLISAAYSLLWLYSGTVPLLASRPASLAMLASLGIPSDWDWLVFIGSALWDILLGIALLTRWRWHSALWLLQIATVSAYTLILSFGMPELWLHPFAPLAKNLPLLILLIWICCNLDNLRSTV